MTKEKILKAIPQILISISIILYIYYTWPKANIIFEYLYYIFIWALMATFFCSLAVTFNVLALFSVKYLFQFGEYLTKDFKGYTFLDTAPELGTFWISLIICPIICVIIEKILKIIEEKNQKQNIIILSSLLFTTIIYYFISPETQATTAAWLFLFPFWYIVKIFKEFFEETNLEESLVYNTKTNSYKKRYTNASLNPILIMSSIFYILFYMPMYLYDHKDHLLTVLIDIIKLTSY